MQANSISDVKSSLVLSFTKDNDTLTEFGDDDALLSVASGAIEVKSNADSRGSSGPLHTRISEQSLKPSELREQISTERGPLDYETSPRVSTEELDFESLGLVGRDIQIASLKACFDRISASQTENESSPTKERNKGHKELLLIAGESGAGKSSICKVLEKQMIATKSGVFVEGKFNMYTSDEPYSGIAKALSAMCKMASSDKSSESGLQQKIVSSLHGDDTRLLIYLVPELANLMPDQNSTNSYTSEHFEAQEVENGVERLRYAFRLLIRVFCGHFAPMVLFFDDLQWADVSSLQMIDYLMSDTENESPLLIIGTYRSDEADENSLLFNKILVLKDKSSVDGYRVTEVDVPPFQSEDTLAAIKSVMKSVDESDAKLLADLCIKRTLGNPYFIVEFLKLLYKEGLIEHSDDSKMWTWDLARIEDATMSTANVVILLQDQMRRLTRQAQVFLRCAAHLGSTFSTTVLGIIWKTHGINMSMGAQGTFSELMAMVVKDNYIEEHCPGKFRWVHDKVQETALYLLGDANASFKLDIGTTLYYSLDSDQLEQHLFTVVDLINKGNRKKRQEFAAVNLRAAEKAMGLSAFQSAASYAAHGISLLQEDGWSTGWMGDRQIKLKLYTRGAEAEQILGNVETAERYIEEVLKQDNFTVLETLPLKMVKGKMMCTMQLRHRDAIDYYIAALNELDFKLIASRRLAPLKACYAVSKIVKKLRRLPKGFMKDLGVISDARQKGILALIGLLRDAAYSGKEPMLCVLADCKTIEMTLKHGVSEYSGASFAAVGAAVMHFQQDYETTQHLMELALAIQEIAGRSGKGKTIQLANMNGFAWTTSLNCIDSMATGYNVALQMGEIVPANWNLLYEVRQYGLLFCFKIRHCLMPLLLPLRSGLCCPSIWECRWIEFLESVPEFLHEYKKPLNAHVNWYSELSIR